MNAQDQMVHVVRARTDDEGNYAEEDTFIVTEVADEVIDVHLSPRTDEAVTFTLTVEGAWRLIRELATSAAIAEQAAE